MGEHVVRGARDDAEVRAFTRAMLEDLRALEELLERGGIERGVRRVGLEQEMFLVDAEGRPACVAEELLERAADPRLTTELARFNLEANVEPRLLGGDFLRRMEDDLHDVLGVVARAGAPLGARPLLVGILPSLTSADLSLDAMARVPRYFALNDALTRLRGGGFSVTLRGVDTLETSHESIMLESANTSFQLHLQVDADELAPLYNLAQLITAPLLAAAVGSPLLFGKRLWQETRVALFERAPTSSPPRATASALRSRGSTAAPSPPPISSRPSSSPPPSAASWISVSRPPTSSVTLARCAGASRPAARPRGSSSRCSAPTARTARRAPRGPSRMRSSRTSLPARPRTPGRRTASPGARAPPPRSPTR